MNAAGASVENSPHALRAVEEMESRMLRNSWILALAGAALMAGTALAGTFGTVVSIGGQAADVALDEARGVLYIANFTANRIDVMSLAANTIQTSINVPAQPSSISLSPDGRWLIVAHYGNTTAPASPQNGLTLIDLANKNAKQTFALGDPPLGVAFGIDNKALVVTTTAFLIFDPAIGTTTTLRSIQATAAKALPVPAANFPPEITGASVAASADYTTIYGLADDLVFRYDVGQHALYGGNYSSAPPQGPRAVSVARDGSYAAMGWEMTDSSLHFYAEFPNASGILNVGGHAVDSDHGLVYSEVPTSAGASPVLTVRDADNLTLRESIQLPEHMAGNAVLSSDDKTIYAVSDSGVMVLPVGNLNDAPRVEASAQDLVFRGNFCDRNVATQTLTITDPGGGHTPFTITSSTAGLAVTPASGMTPATVQVTVDPNAFSDKKGTVQASLTIASDTAANIANPVRVLINSREPDQRGTFVDIPGTLVGLAADPVRQRYYVLRQDQNQVLVFNGTNNTQIATLRTCTKPMSMAATFDGRTLLVGCDNSHLMSVFDLETLQAMPSIDTLSGYVQSVAVSSKAILAVMRDGGGGNPYIARVDLVTRVAPRMNTLGVFDNRVPLDTVLTASPNGSHILAASSDGSVMLYDANVDSFTISRKDFSGLSGAYAASAFDQFVVGNNLLNSSLVPEAQFETGTGSSSGFVFVDQTGYRTTAPDSASPGVIQQVDLTTGAGIRPTRMAEAPILGSDSSIKQVFTASLVALQDRSEFVSLTTSGITALPWNYDASVAPPQISAVVSAADNKSPAAPGGLITVWGSDLSPTNLATSEIPVPTALADSCLTVNGQPMPLIFVSPNQINAQMPFQAIGNVTVIVHTPGGVSDNFNLTVQPTAPAVFLSGVAGPEIDVPTVVRASNNLLVTDSDPVHRGDTLIIYLTGLGAVSPVVDNGTPAPSDTLALALTQPTVTLGGVNLGILYAGLAPGEVGVYQINVTVPQSAPQGLSVPLTITQGTSTHTVDVRVVQ
jgi:uncharacterized protein (TIGR03437 family)